MNINDIRELAEIMNSTGLTEIELEESGSKIRLAKSVATIAQTPVVFPQVTENPQEAVATIENQLEGRLIKSPTVGIFYASPSPESDVYVSVGSKFKNGDVICIIEAMKLMNEIQADSDGEIIEILVGNGQVVEYDQPLFRVR